MTRRLDDERLVAAFRGGDEAAFEQLDARYRPQLTRFAGKVLRQAGPDLAEDVVQEALWRAHRALRRDDRPMQLRPWLYRLVRNCCLDELGRVRGGAVELEDTVLLADPRDEPVVAAERRDDLRRLLDDVAALPTSQRHALVRRELDGLSHAEVAAELQVTPLAARSLVHRARCGLARAHEARSADCGPFRDDLLAAHDERRRANARTLRHVATCPECRALRGALKAQRRQLHVLAPPAGLLLALTGVKLFAAGKATGGAKAAAGTAAVVAAGTTLGVQVFAAGDPSPVALRSLALPGGAVAMAAPLPSGTAVVRHRVVPREQRLDVACPPGLRVADLLPPEGGRVDAAYAPGTRIGTDATATVLVAPHAGISRTTAEPLVLGVLCKRPDAGGSIVDPTARPVEP
ncbi:RNA polymerase sigma factor [Conexibacter sp. SYSU D00693]|uniref:RNA polymerase sigma factor n=1 Tax=Conexibacter sp. SYSU D00693 TaxID=2812560 RepID=UPI00196A9E81|nr:sigma-70 family RNA polymerase sigma factor [Conexibacter sp. SYSU D00693]